MDVSLLFKLEHLHAEVAAFVQSIHFLACFGCGYIVADQVPVVRRLSVRLQQGRSQLVQNADAPVLPSQF